MIGIMSERQYTFAGKGPCVRYRERIYGDYRNLTGHPATPDHNAAKWTDFVARYLPKDLASVIVDLGCGGGDMLRAAQRAGYTHLRGVDVSAQQVKQAIHDGLPVTLEQLADFLPAQPDASIDVVVAYDLVEHLTRDEMLALADEVRRVLRPNGRWVIHTVNADSPFFGAIRYGDVTHEMAYNRHSISHLLNAAGFDRVDCQEDPPLRYGLTGWARAVLWIIVSFPMRVVWAIETGVLSSILTRNFLIVAEP